MKKSKISIKKWMTLILTGFVILFFNSCQDLNDDDMDLNLNSDEQLISWNELLNQVDLESEIAFVQNGESIQDAIDVALSGDVIYIEPGIYQEDLSNKKSDIKLIGLSLSPNDLIINRAAQNGIEILKLYDQKSIDNFKNSSQKHGKGNRIFDFSRTELGKGIAHYQFKVRVGKGEYDVITIHRVVRKKLLVGSYHTDGQVFMIHGALAGFVETFFSPGLENSKDINANTSSPYYLALNNIDVRPLQGKLHKNSYK